MVGAITWGDAMVKDTFSPSYARYGRVSLKVRPGRYESFLVKQEEDGDCSYYLGSIGLCSTSDGWVTLPGDEVKNVVWDK